MVLVLVVVRHVEGHGQRLAAEQGGVEGRESALWLPPLPMGWTVHTAGCWLDSSKPAM